MTRNSRVPRIENRRCRMVLEAPVETVNALGGATIAFQPITTLWAQLEARGGTERDRGGRLEGTTDSRITIRWRGGIDARMRFTFGARVFAIRSSFDPDGRKRDLVCVCEEITS